MDLPVRAKSDWRLKAATSCESAPQVFHLFPSLPVETRLKIWRFTFTPRIISMYEDRDICAWRLGPTTHLPIALHICHESRAEALRFYSLDLICKWSAEPHEYYDGRPVDSLNDRHVAYFNYEIDTLRVDVDDFWLTRCVTPQGADRLRKIMVFKEGTMLGFRTGGPNFYRYPGSNGWYGEKDPVENINFQDIICPHVSEIWQVAGLQRKYWLLNQTREEDEAECEEDGIEDDYGWDGSGFNYDDDQDTGKYGERDDTQEDDAIEPDPPRQAIDCRYYVYSGRAEMSEMAWETAREVSKRHRMVDHEGYPKMRRLRIYNGLISRIQVIREVGDEKGMPENDGREWFDVERYTEGEAWAVKKRRMVWNVLAGNVSNTLRMGDDWPLYGKASRADEP